MYTLSPPDIAKFDLADAARFVEFWSRFYDYQVESLDANKQKIDYFTEVNLGSNLTEENVRRLLRWKDYRFLTDPNKKTGQRNPKVKKVIDNLSIINAFRNGQMTEEDMQHATEMIFESPSIVWRVFLLHISKPDLYPIADQNVFRAYSLHTGRPEPQTWQDYAGYVEYFGNIAGTVGVPQTVSNLTQLKRIDNALFVFGQFLAAHYRAA